jgi:hypothetical protein
MRRPFLARLTRAPAIAALVAALSLAGSARAPGAAPPAPGPAVVSAAAPSASALVVIVGAQNPLRDISRQTLRRAYLSETTEEQGVRMVPLNQMPGAPARVAFDRTLLGLEPDAVARFWIDQRIRGQGNAPRGIPNVALLLRVLAQLPGGISYLRRADLPANAPGVKVLTIDGKKPGEPGYLFP